MSDAAIKVNNVTKKFILPHQRVSTLKSYITNPLKKTEKETQLALNDVSFEIKEGEFFGIVGRNGSGKSTLLKCIAGVYSPDDGDIKVNGSLVPFIELGVGFNPELSGRDNVYLNGALLGFSRKEMGEKYDEIVEFAELEQFMDQKLKNYSSGMQVRLAFSIAIQSKGDILLLDEVLAVGDANFQKKCTRYFDSLIENGKTVILVTHSMDSINKYCTRALLLEQGVIKTIGDPEEVASQYSLDNITKSTSTKLSPEENKNKHLDDQVASLEVVPKSPLLVSRSEGFNFEVSYRMNTDLSVYIGISLKFQNISVIEHNTTEVKITNKPDTTYRMRYRVPMEFLNTGRQFQVSAAIFNAETKELLGFNTDSCIFEIKSEEGKTGGLLAKKGEWTISKKGKE